MCLMYVMYVTTVSQISFWKLDYPFLGISALEDVFINLALYKYKYFVLNYATGPIFMKGLSQGLGLKLRLLSQVSAQKLLRLLS